MFTAIKNRRPWVAATISFFVPFVGMLYLNRGRLALVYAIAGLGIGAAILLNLPKAVRPNDFVAIVQIPASIISIVAAIQAYRIAKRWQADRTRNWFTRNWYWVGVAVFSLVGGLLFVRAFFYQPFSVPSASMIPTVNVGDFFLTSKWKYSSTDPARGDVVVFHTKKFGNTYFFKRIIGLPGERIQLMHGTVFINGRALARKRINGRPQIPGVLLCDAAVVCEAAEFVETLPSGVAYTVLELERNGPSDNTEVLVVPENSYFVLGDNRDNSADSRNSLGFVRRDNIIGQAVIKYISEQRWTWQPIR